MRSKARSRGGLWGRTGDRGVRCDSANADRGRRSESGAALPSSGRGVAVEGNGELNQRGGNSFEPADRDELKWVL